MFVMVVVVIVVPIIIAAMIVIPFVVMVKAAMIAFPVAPVIEPSLVAWSNPTGASVRRTSPIAFMPAIVPAHGIPVTINPNKLRTRAWRVHVYDSRLRRTTDSDADSNLRACAVAAEQQHCGKQRKSGEVSHFL